MDLALKGASWLSKCFQSRARAPQCQRGEFYSHKATQTPASATPTKPAPRHPSPHIAAAPNSHGTSKKPLALAVFCRLALPELRDLHWADHFCAAVRHARPLPEPPTHLDPALSKAAHGRHLQPVTDLPRALAGAGLTTHQQHLGLCVYMRMQCWGLPAFLLALKTTSITRSKHCQAGSSQTLEPICITPTPASLFSRAQRHGSSFIPTPFVTQGGGRPFPIRPNESHPPGEATASPGICRDALSAQLGLKAAVGARLTLTSEVH